MLKSLIKKDNSNLIDLAPGVGFENNSHLSVLEDFDPLCSPMPKPVPLTVTTITDSVGKSCLNLFFFLFYWKFGISK